MDKKNINILIVDDIANMRRTIRNMLKFSGYKNFYEAENGKEALKILEKHKIDLMLVDWNMPVMNGMELLKKIRNDEKLKFIPFIMITGELDKNTIAEAAEYGADEYLVKPFITKTLEKKIENVFSARTAPNKPSFHYFRGEKFSAENNDKEALEAFKTAIKLDKEFLKAYVGMARVLIKNNKLKEAEEVLKETIKINSNYIEANQLLGEIYLMLNKDDDALFFLKQAYNLNPKNIDRNIKIGDVHLKRDEIEEADKFFQEAIKYDKSKTDAIIKIADTLMKYQKYEKAETILNDLTKDFPDLLIAYNRLGIALRKQGKYKEALEAYNRALQYYKKDENIYYNIGRTYFEINDYRKAYNYFKKALKLNPEFKEAKEALELIKKYLN